MRRANRRRPGHGAIANRQDLLGYGDMLCAIEGRIKPRIAARLPVAEIIAAAPTRDFDVVWGRGYVTGDFFVRMVLAGLGLTEKAKEAVQGFPVSGPPIGCIWQVRVRNRDMHFIENHGQDMPKIRNWRWSTPSNAQDPTLREGVNAPWKIESPASS
jgi:hypothetical protein